jgi:YidC/Oxa1 family membrane protein insertase
VGEIGNLFNLIFTNPIFNALMVLYRVFGDFGLAIVVLTIIIKLLLVPLTLQQLKSMKANQELQPLLAEIRKKYANNQQEQMLRIQALYKEKGINPAAGCLPLIIQLPILYGLFYALEGILATKNLTVETINSRLYSFVQPFTHLPNINLEWFTFINHAWFISLGKPDPTHILPILAGLATFVQLRMSQARTQAMNGGAAPANDPTTQSMKMMQYVMPFVTVFIAWNFASGLALYWTVSYAFQAIQQFFVTGWGALAPAQKEAPETKQEKTITSNTKSTSTLSKSKDKSAAIAGGPAVATAGDASSEGGTGVVESRLRTTPRNNGSSSNNRRRQRGSSASARRRGSTQRSRG